MPDEKGTGSPATDESVAAWRLPLRAHLGEYAPCPNVLTVACRRFLVRSPLLWAGVFAAACDSETSKVDAVVDAGRAPPPAQPAAAAPEAPGAPEIIVDNSSVAIGADRVPAGEQGMADKVAVFVTGRPAIAGQAVDMVAMRNAKPSQVAAVVSALRRAKASGVNIKTEARDGTTQKLPLSFPAGVPDCATVAWIAKDAAIDVWPASGGTAKRVVKGMAGPDMTLGTEAVRRQANGCSASPLIVGGDERFTWGLVFDLATMSLQLPGMRASGAVLVTSAVPGRKLTLETQ
ncbi:MAG TPA: hypothetical protein VN894_01115 [Polyangiaceae bacterium]|nr:hypothetical protein [Polyangiaceae bacterium]